MTIVQCPADVRPRHYNIAGLILILRSDCALVTGGLDGIVPMKRSDQQVTADFVLV